MKNRFEQPSALIGVLLDQTAEHGDRDDAAMDLGQFDDQAAESALATIATDPAADEDLVDTCGEALAAIWLRKGAVNRDLLMRLVPISARVCIATLRASSVILADAAEEHVSSARRSAEQIKS